MPPSNDNDNNDRFEIDSFEFHRRMPSYQARLAAEKKINVYYIPGNDARGQAMYVYAVCSAMLHELFVEAVSAGVVPDYAVIVAKGDGEPDMAIKAKILDYYGFDHDAAA